MSASRVTQQEEFAGVEVSLVDEPESWRSDASGRPTVQDRQPWHVREAVACCAEHRAPVTGKVLARGARRVWITRSVVGLLCERCGQPAVYEVWA